MFAKLLVLGSLAAGLAVTPAQAWVNGNDTGGIIPWSPENEMQAYPTAQAHCGYYGKEAHLTSVYRQYGHYIGFACVFPRGYIVRERGFAIRARG